MLDDPAVNAFAMPGGYIYVTRGLLAHMKSEAQLAGVLGHEIGHVTARHSARQMTQQQLAGLGLQVASAVSLASSSRILAVASTREAYEARRAASASLSAAAWSLAASM